MPSKRGQIFLIGPHVFWSDERNLVTVVQLGHRGTTWSPWYNLVTVVKSGHSGEMGAP